MQGNGRALADHGQPPPEAGGQACCTLGHARQGSLNDRLRCRAAVLALTTIFAASSAPGVLASDYVRPAAPWTSILVPLPLLAATLLAIRRRSKAGPRGIRLLDPVGTERGSASPATGG
ncbi:hypothetical protein GCM10009416_45190 [Craurococcus roseus]|uniref:Uncharacterized protein n=1 Tax=Craurococcus roseus TaxID=77585 RepID=A0ABP3R7Y5_9PROT